MAPTEAKVKEATGWKATDIDGTTALHGVACLEATSCVAVDGEGHVLELTINGSGEATVVKRDIDGGNDITGVACVSEATCAAVDSSGNIFIATAGDETWADQHSTGTELTSVACASMSLCIASDRTGHMTAFIPIPVPPSYTQTVDSGSSLNAVACLQNKPECVITDSKGDAYYTTNVSAAASATWKAWSGPASPSEAVSCPTSSLCVIADGKASEGGGGDVYYATSLGGTWKEAFAPSWGVDALSCPAVTFCIAGQAEGYIHYSTKPASTEWHTLSIAPTAIDAVSCISAVFCAAVDHGGEVYIANSEAKVKEEAGWTAKDIDGTVALRGVVCTTVSWCVAIDNEGHVLDISVNSKAEATATKEDIDGKNELTAVTCTGQQCVVTDSKGNVYTSANSGETWTSKHAFGVGLTDVACVAPTLCLTTENTGEVSALTPE